MLYIVRDKETKGCDFLLWGDDKAAAEVSLASALSDDLDVELVAMVKLDKHTKQLIEG